MKAVNIWRSLMGAGAVVMAATPAAAHHVMDGKLPSTFMEGVLSGLGHPVIGPDHLAFIIAIGFAAALVPAGVGLIGAFVAASTLGVVVHLGAWNLPVVETLVAASVVAAGALVASGRSAGSGAWVALVAAAGLFHGYAFGESIVGAERGVLGAYLLGLAIIAAVIALGVRALVAQLAVEDGRQPRLVRAGGLVIGIVGVALLASSLVIV
jgi:urease accessory protein